MTTTTIMWTCCGEEVYDQAGIIAHLVKAHGVARPIVSSRKGVTHLDGPGWSLNTYEHTIGSLVLHQTIKTEEEPAP